jgi:hypothetical protein
MGWDIRWSRSRRRHSNEKKIKCKGRNQAALFVAQGTKILRLLFIVRGF